MKMIDIKGHTKSTASLLTGILFLSIQILVSLHYAFIDHHNHSHFNSIQFTTESEHPCQVSDYFSFKLPWNKVLLNLGFVVYTEDLRLPEFQIWHIGFEHVISNRGPPVAFLFENA